jgi:recombination protein RecT
MSENNSMAKVDAFKNILNQQTIRAQLRNTLHDNAGAFMSSMIDLYEGDNYLQNCDPQAVAMECMKAASLKLPLVKSLGFAYVVPFKNVPTFTIGYKGLIQLAQRSGTYKTINADAVYEGEFVSKDKLSGMIDLSGERKSDTVIGYFAYFKLLNGFEKILYMTKAEVEAWGAKYSPSYSSNSTPWKKEFAKMAMKTVLRQLIGKYGPMSDEMQTAFSNDDKGTTPQQEIKDQANKQMIDIDPETGEVKDGELPSDKPQEATNASGGETTPPPAGNKPTGSRKCPI